MNLFIMILFIIINDLIIIIVYDNSILFK